MNPDIIEALYENVDINIIKYLLDRGDDPNCVTAKGNITPLMVAAELGNLEVVQLLLSCGATNVHALDDDSENILHFAAKGGNVQLVQLLLDLGVNCNQQNRAQERPIVHSLKFLNVVKLLFPLTANPERPNLFKQNLLHLAVQNSAQDDVIPYLLEQGISAHAQDNVCESPIQYAQKFKVAEKSMTALKKEEIEPGCHYHKAQDKIELDNMTQRLFQEMRQTLLSLQVNNNSQISKIPTEIICHVFSFIHSEDFRETAQEYINRNRRGW